MGLILLGIGVSVFAIADDHGDHGYHGDHGDHGHHGGWAAPEINPASGTSALALVAGMFVLTSGRRKKC